MSGGPPCKRCGEPTSDRIIEGDIEEDLERESAVGRGRSDGVGLSEYEIYKGMHEYCFHFDRTIEHEGEAVGQEEHCGSPSCFAEPPPLKRCPGGDHVFCTEDECICPCHFKATGELPDAGCVVRVDEESSPETERILRAELDRRRGAGPRGTRPAT